MTHPTMAFSGSIINRFTGSKILARVGQISVAFPHAADDRLCRLSRGNQRHERLEGSTCRKEVKTPVGGIKM